MKPSTETVLKLALAVAIVLVAFVENELIDKVILLTLAGLTVVLIAVKLGVAQTSRDESKSLTSWPCLASAVLQHTSSTVSSRRRGRHL